MAIITDELVRQQMPGYHLEKDGSGTGNNITGVVDPGLRTQEDYLLNQSMNLARSRRGFAYEDGADFPEEFTQMMRKLNLPNRLYGQSLSEDTVKQLLNGGLERDQQYIGVGPNNSNWTGYYLEPLAKFIVPFDTPTRNMLPRIGSTGIDRVNWRAITDVFGGTGPTLSSFILPQTVAPQKAQYSWSDKSNLLRQLAFSDIVTFESELFGRMFEPDVRAKVASKLAPSLMLGQELAYLNGAQQLWPPAPPNTGTTAGTGGTLAATTTFWIIVTALTSTGPAGESLAWGGNTPTALAITTGAAVGTNTVSFNIMRVPNATSYHVYMGTGTTQPATSAMWLQTATLFAGGATSLNDPGGFSAGYFNVTMTGALATSGTAYSTIVSGTGASAVPVNPPYVFVAGTGNSGVPSGMNLMFDGIQSLAYTTYLNTLSTAGVGGVISTIRRVADPGGALAKSDIDAQLEAMYLNSRANPECILVGVKDHKAISNIVATGTNFRVLTPATPAGLSDVPGGLRATKWVNQTTGRLMDIIMVPYLQQGTIIFLSLTLPFQVAEITKPVLRVEVNREMWAVEYPPDQSHMTQWAYAAYTSEGVVNQYLGGTGLLAGIVTA